MVTPGQRVYYAYQGGWGGGETHQAIGLVLKATKRMAVIALRNSRGLIVEKSVSQAKLAVRGGSYTPIDYDLDAYAKRWQRRFGEGGDDTAGDEGSG